MGFFVLIALEFREEKPAVKMKNVGKGEGIFRSIIGVILIILAFFISGVFQWILGLVGVVVILTAIFGY
jgi:predicted phage tail protein